MSDLFFNKVAAAILASALGFIVIHKVAESAVSPDVPSIKEFAYLPEMDLDAGQAEKIEIPFPSAEWIAARNADKGKKIFGKCTSCHNANNGGANGTGPNLWNVVGAPAGQHAGFAYSSAVAGSGITWTYEHLDGYLANPKSYIPKNNMAFIGLKKEADRAAVIEYLRLQSDAPIAPLTEAAPIPGAEDTAAELLDDAGNALQDAVETVQDAAQDIMPKDEGHNGGH